MGFKMYKLRQKNAALNRVEKIVRAFLKAFPSLSNSCFRK